MKSLRDTTFVSVPGGVYGFGIGKIGNWYGHNGSIPGYNSSMFYNPILDLTVIVLANLQTSMTEGSVAKFISQDIISSIDNGLKNFKTAYVKH